MPLTFTIFIDDANLLPVSQVKPHQNGIHQIRETGFGFAKWNMAVCAIQDVAHPPAATAVAAMSPDEYQAQYSHWPSARLNTAQNNT